MTTELPRIDWRTILFAAALIERQTADGASRLKAEWWLDPANLPPKAPKRATYTPLWALDDSTEAERKARAQGKRDGRKRFFHFKPDPKAPTVTVRGGQHAPKWVVYATELERWFYSGARTNLEPWAFPDSKKYVPVEIDWTSDQREAREVHAALSALSDALALPRVFASDRHVDHDGHSLEARLEALNRQYKDWKRGRTEPGTVALEASAVAAFARAAPARVPVPVPRRRIVDEEILDEMRTAVDPRYLAQALDLLEEPEEDFDKAETARQFAKQAQWRAEHAERSWRRRNVLWEGIDGSVDAPITGGRASRELDDSNDERDFRIDI